MSPNRFCDRYISPAELLNIISAFGWYLDSVIASEAVTPMDTKVRTFAELL